MERISAPAVFQLSLSKDTLVPNGKFERLQKNATRSRCEGRVDYAGLLTDLATEILEHARDIEQRIESGDISPSLGKLKSSRPDAA
jgi:hypothetical protein